MSSSGVGRDVHSSMSSIQHFFCRPRRRLPSKVFWGWFWRRCRGVLARGVGGGSIFVFLRAPARAHIYTHTLFMQKRWKVASNVTFQSMQPASNRMTGSCVPYRIITDCFPFSNFLAEIFSLKKETIITQNYLACLYVREISCTLFLGLSGKSRK